jgi:hypothetical protein
VRQFQFVHLVRRFRRALSLSFFCCVVAFQLAGFFAAAADVTFNITLVGESDPIPGSGSLYYGDVWGDGNYAYVGADVNGGGIAIFDISNPASPQFLTEYEGDQMEDVEVHNGIGYFSSDVSVSAGTGVDIVDLDPESPTYLERLSRINGAIGGHNKVHTVSVDNGFLYTVDNAANQPTADYVKVWDISNPSDPQFVTNIDLGLPSRIASHEVVATNGRIYVASKNNNNNSGDGWTHIYDVSNVGTTGAVLLKAFESGPRTHTSRPTGDGNTLIVAEERPDGNVNIYDISMIDQQEDPDSPLLLSTLNRTSVGIDAHSPHHPQVVGDLLFVSWYEAGLQVFNIADPANPMQVGAFDTFPGTSTLYNGDWGVFPFLGLDKVLLGDRARGLMVVDASELAPTGDFDFDGDVDGRDFLVWQRGNSPNPLSAADLADWSANYGGNPLASSRVVPEPNMLALLAIFGCCLFMRGNPWKYH